MNVAFALMQRYSSAYMDACDTCVDLPHYEMSCGVADTLIQELFAGCPEDDDDVTPEIREQVTSRIEEIIGDWWEKLSDEEKFLVFAAARAMIHVREFNQDMGEGVRDKYGKMLKQAMDDQSQSRRGA